MSKRFMMPMPDQMNMPWYMGRIEWLEMAVFWLAVIAVLIVFLASLPVSRTRTKKPVSGWRDWPEVKLVMLALPLELLWELAQFPLYDVWHQNDWGYILYGLAHCTLGDLLILLVLYEVIALLNRNRSWYAINRVATRGSLFTLLGAGYTVYSEIMNVRIKGTWGYTEQMPLLPIVDIGGMPFLQWLLIPPLLLWLMRMTDTGQQTQT
ncbi:MAG TPA: hypothetical protein ENI64_12930 [Gammaproteobacteria bacterium]|nr:hypothetical protein [Gammaproteobacteria bacterium]